MNTRIFTGKSDPVRRLDEGVIKCLNRVLQNTLEQTFIFLTGLIYYVAHQKNKQTLPAIYSLGIAFVLGRVLFTAGYLLSTINPKFPMMRTAGFTISVFVNLTLILENFGIKNTIELINGTH